MGAAKSELNQLLTLNGKRPGNDYQLALAEVFQYKLEGQVTNKVSKQLIKLLDQGLRRDRTEIIFGLRSHDQIIMALAESHGYQAKNFFVGLNLLVQNGKIVSDGLPNMKNRKLDIKAKIPLQTPVATTSRQPPTTSGFSRQTPTSRGGSFTVAIPI